MSHDTLLDLSRWQWAITAAMHITFPAITVGTSVLLVVCYAMYMRTDDDVWLRMFRFWRRIFGIGFALGASGAGKSTLFRAIAGSPAAGIEVRLGGVDPALLCPEDVAKRVALVAHDAHVFAGTIRDNLLLADPEARERELWEALAAAALLETVAGFPDGLDTQVGPGGEALSGGQRRRLSVAQGVLRRPAVLLLDEPTEGLDTATATHLLAGARAALPETLLVIALHDRQTPDLPWLPTQQIRLRPAVTGAETNGFRDATGNWLGQDRMNRTTRCCSPKLNQRRSQMQTPIELVRTFCAAWSDNVGTDDLAAFFTDDAVYHNIPLPPVTGKENIADNLDSYIRPGAPGVEGIEFQLINIAADGPVVMTERWDVFKLSDTSFGLPVMGTFEVRDGKISAWRDYFDMSQFVSLMGDHPLQVERRKDA